MRRTRLAAVLVAACVLMAAAACGGGAAAPIRVGLLVDCDTLSAFREPTIAAVEAPLLDRGARPAGALPSAGLTGARIAGHPVEITTACTALGGYSRLLAATREFVERDRVDIVIGPIGAVEGVLLRRVAERYPDVTFVLGVTGASGVTFRDPAPNVFRFGATSLQGVAGLGTFAYRDLGWRTAAIVADDYSAGWEYDAAFTAEFCALGGRVVHHDYTSLSPGLPAPLPGEVRAARAADGVALLSITGVLVPLGQDAYIDAYARGRDDLSRRVVLGGPTFAVPQNLDWRRDPTGVVVAGDAPYAPNAAGETLARTMAEAFPGLPRGIAPSEIVNRYAEAAQAVVRALESAGGDLSAGQARFRAALSALRLDGPQGSVRLDGNRQGIVSAYLGRVRRTTGAAPTIIPLRRLDGVDQRLGGLLTAVPQRAPVPCVRRALPPWAR